MDASVTETIRHQIRTLLEEGPLTAKEISSAVRRPEKEIANHLEHLRKSLHSEGRRLSRFRPNAGGAGSCSGSGAVSRRRADVPSAREKRFPTHLSAWKTGDRNRQVVIRDFPENKNLRPFQDDFHGGGLSPLFTPNGKGGFTGRPADKAVPP